ncbi:MAG TPA: hypothetical protein ENH55_12860, partial [Aurantimonas coralicida]|nr:hypothetical protein [Aurantimonas coralicida]
MTGERQTGDAAGTQSGLPVVRLSELRLADFRNYETLRLTFDRGFVAFVGDNGAGKTNLIEAVSLLTPGRGLRRATYQDIARKDGSGGFSIRAGLVSLQS